MKVWVIGRGYPSVKNQMLGSFELEQAKMLARGGVKVVYPQVDMRSIRRWRKFGIEWRTEDNVVIPTLNIPIGRLLNKDKRDKLFPKLMIKLEEKIINKYGLPDVVHVHYPSIFPYVIVDFLQQRGVKIVSTEHWTKVFDKSLDEESLHNLTEFTEKGDAICCVGTPLKNSIIELTHTEKKVYIVPNIVGESFKPAEKHHKGFLFVTAGRLVPVKQYDKIVSAFLNVFSGNEDVTLSMAGEGKEREKIQKIIEERDSKHQVHMLGEISREQMVELISTCDVLIVFSELETFCVPVIEAWACGKPVITTTTTVFAENPDSRLGIMVDWENQNSLENALQYLYEHYTEYDPEWISRYAQEHFSEDVVRRKLLELYSLS